MHEIISIQLGLESNYLATHFWNAQEAYFPLNAGEESPVDSDINFRRGLDLSGVETYNPRTLIYDVKDNFGPLQRVYEEPDDPVSNGDAPQTANPTIIREPEIPQHPFQASASNWDSVQRIDSVRYWSDFRRVAFHPRSSLPIDGGEGLTSYQTGEEWWKAAEEASDAGFRWLAEECDQMQGIVMYAGMENAWGAFAGEFAERLRDEMGTKPIWVWTDVTKRHQCSVVSIDRLAEHASLLCPLTFFENQRRPSYLHFSRTSPWEVSAVQAAAVETLTLPSRLHAGQRGAMSMGQTEGSSFAPDHVIMRAEMSAEDLRQDGARGNGHHGNGHRNGDGHHDGDGDLRMREREDAPASPAALDAPLDLQFLPRVALAGLRPKTFSTVDVLRGNDYAWRVLHPDDADPAAVVESGRDEAGVLRRYLPTRLKFPQPNSYPAVFREPSAAPSRAGSFGVGTGEVGGEAGARGPVSDMAGGLPVRARLVADTGVAGWVRRFSLKARLLELPVREQVTDRLLELADRYVGGEWGVEEESDDEEE